MLAKPKHSAMRSGSTANVMPGLVLRNRLIEMTATSRGSGSAKLHYMIYVGSSPSTPELAPAAWLIRIVISHLPVTLRLLCSVSYAVMISLS